MSIYLAEPPKEINSVCLSVCLSWKYDNRTILKAMEMVVGNLLQVGTRTQQRHSSYDNGDAKAIWCTSR